MEIQLKTSQCLHYTAVLLGIRRNGNNLQLGYLLIVLCCILQTVQSDWFFLIHQLTDLVLDYRPLITLNVKFKYFEQNYNILKFYSYHES